MYFPLFLKKMKLKKNHNAKPNWREKVAEKAAASQSCWEFAAGLDCLQPPVLLHRKGSKAHLNIPEGQLCHGLGRQEVPAWFLG